MAYTLGIRPSPSVSSSHLELESHSSVNATSIDLTTKSYILDIDAIPKPMDEKSLKEKLQVSYSNIRFLQKEHALTIQGLHDEIEKLQNMYKDLEFRVEMGNLLIDEDKYREKIMALDFKTNQLHSENEELKRKLQDSKHMNEILDQKQKLLKWQHHQELEERDATITRLQRELETKCSAVAQLTSQLHRKKKSSSFLRRFSFTASEPTSLPSTPIQKSHIALSRADSRKTETIPYLHNSETHSLPIYESQLHSFLQGNSSYSSLSDKSASDDDCLNRNSFSAKNQSVFHSSGSSCNKELPVSRHSTVKLPPIQNSQLLSRRQQVRHQLRVDKTPKFEEDTLAIDQISSPELRIKRVSKT